MIDACQNVPKERYAMTENITITPFTKAYATGMAICALLTAIAAAICLATCGPAPDRR